MSSTLNQQIIDAQMEFVTQRIKELDSINLKRAMEITGDDEYDLGIDSFFWFKIVHVCKHF